MHGKTWTARCSAALGLAAATLAAAMAPAAAGVACAGPAVATGVLGPLALPPGTVRPAFPLRGAGAKAPVGAVLDGILVPATADDRTRTALAEAIAVLAAGPVAIHADRPRLDRRGRAAGVVETSEGLNLQVELLARGLVVADGEDTPCAAERVAAERTARAAGRGLWAGGALPRSASAPARDLPDFLVLSGAVRSVGKSGRTTYLNFGRRFSDDLTVRLTPAVAEGLTARGIAPETLAGRRVILRGWAEPRDGIDIALASPAALELDEGSKAR